MWARVTTMQGPPESVDEAIDQVKSTVLPQMRDVDGFQGMWMLVDRASGRGLGFTLWESQEAMEASEQRADQVRDRSAQDTGAQVANVERFEVAFHETV